MFVIDSEDKLEMVLEGVDGVSVVEAGDWIDDGKYSSFENHIIEFEGKFFSFQGYSRSGSYFSDYYYNTEGGDFTDLCLKEVQKKEVLVSQWVVV